MNNFDQLNNCYSLKNININKATDNIEQKRYSLCVTLSSGIDDIIITKKSERLKEKTKTKIKKPWIKQMKKIRTGERKRYIPLMIVEQQVSQNNHQIGMTVISKKSMLKFLWCNSIHKTNDKSENNMSCLSHEMTQITYDVSQYAGHNDFSEYFQYCTELDIDASKLKLIVPSGNGEIRM